MKERVPHPQKAKSPPIAGTSKERLMGFEPTTFCMASRRSSQLSYSRAVPDSSFTTGNPASSGFPSLGLSPRRGQYLRLDPDGSITLVDGF
jgi:hypothetical protein